MRRRGANRHHHRAATQSSPFTAALAKALAARSPPPLGLRPRLRPLSPLLRQPLWEFHSRSICANLCPRSSSPLLRRETLTGNENAKTQKEGACFLINFRANCGLRAVCSLILGYRRLPAPAGHRPRFLLDSPRDAGHPESARDKNHSQAQPGNDQRDDRRATRSRGLSASSGEKIHPPLKTRRRPHSKRNLTRKTRSKARIARASSQY